MDDQLLLTVGVLIFAVTLWATLAFGYWRFGRWYDEETAKEVQRRRTNDDTRPVSDVAHDRPEEVVHLLEEEQPTGAGRG